MNMLKSGVKSGGGGERVRYFPRQLITADDMTAEQQYFRQKMRRHNRFLHGWGVVCGCAVEPYNPEKNRPWQVRVCPGYVITPQGDEILIREAVNFDLAGDWRHPEDPCARPWPCPPAGVRPASNETQDVYLAVCYTECDTRPVRIHPAGCGCDEAACEYSRIRDSFELLRLWELPDSHKKAVEADAKWVEDVETWKANPEPPRPLASCPECPDDPCVVLAKITLPVARDTQISAIDYGDRRVLYSVQALQAILMP